MPATELSSTSQTQAPVPILGSLQKDYCCSVSRAKVDSALLLGLLKIAFSIHVTARKLWVSLPGSFEMEDVFTKAYFFLHC